MSIRQRILSTDVEVGDVGLVIGNKSIIADIVDYD